jgi:hypothetical protein
MKKDKSHPSHKKINLGGKVAEKIIDGRSFRTILWNSPALYQHFLKEECKIGDDISAGLTSGRPKRTTSQNDFYHLYLSLISKSSGHSLIELKAWVRGKILAVGITEVFGDKTRVTKSSADLNISEFCEMMNKIQDITTIPIPDPAPFKLPLTWDEYGHLKAIQDEKYKKLTAKNL